MEQIIYIKLLDEGTDVYRLTIANYLDEIAKLGVSKKYGLSVRCIKDY